MEDKKRFIEMIQDALIECGDGRYDWLDSKPLVYSDNKYGREEFVELEGTNSRVCVTGDSLVAIMEDIAELF